LTSAADRIASIVKFEDIPKKYSELCQILAPRIIHCKKDLKKISEITNAMAGQKLSKDPEDYVNLLCRLIEDKNNILISNVIARLNGSNLHAPENKSGTHFYARHRDRTPKEILACC
jgi:hypothetical protein